jgi:hypothetical protein
VTLQSDIAPACSDDSHGDLLIEYTLPRELVTRPASKDPYHAGSETPKRPTACVRRPSSPCQSSHSDIFILYLHHRKCKRLSSHCRPLLWARVGTFPAQDLHASDMPEPHRYPMHSTPNTPWLPPRPRHGTHGTYPATISVMPGSSARTSVG